MVSPRPAKQRLIGSIENQLYVRAREAFARKTLFYPLFAAIYECTYGLKSSLRSKRGLPLRASDVATIGGRAAKIVSGTAPEEIQKITERRVSQAGVRRQILSYLLKKKVSPDAESDDK